MSADYEAKFGRLPVWARHEIDALKGNVAHWKGKHTEALAAISLTAESHGRIVAPRARTIILGDFEVSYRMGKLDIRSNHAGILIHPLASNHCEAILR